ncbi:MAG: T9SS type A sorting domain-containing protein [Chitinophagaceae bacterium]|nr:T9SS type A sorting domain-containing protein [Chitinophagaceae bacterium]
MKKRVLYFGVMLLLGYAVTAQPTQPAAPLACNANNCTQPVSETCTGASTVVTSFTNATLRSGSPTSLPAVYSFYNIATISGQQINATVTIDAASNCAMNGGNFSIDDDGATDQSGNSIASFFAPRITPSSNLTNSDLRGYVQFTIRFYVENGTAGQQYPGDYTTPPPSGGLTGLNYIHYDIDGSTVGNNGWFRETGVVQNVVGSSINGDVSTELVSYTYTDGGNWKGFAGSVCERTGVSRCSQVAAAASYSTPQTQITVRMGYDYNFTNSNFNSQPTRQYGSRFGCFAFPQQVPLPVKLISFNGLLKNNTAYLNWTAENQVDFANYILERSTDGTTFTTAGAVPRQGTGTGREQYQFADDLSVQSTEVFFYRLKMIDLDGRFSYSNTIMLRKDGVKNSGLFISPNPVDATGTATVRFAASRNGIADIAVTDMAGRIVLRQQSAVYNGTNSIGIQNLQRLQPGTYLLQVANGSERPEVVRFTIAR